MNRNYKDRYNEVESSIASNIDWHEPYLDIDYEELHNLDLSDSEDEWILWISIINPALIDLDMGHSNDINYCDCQQSVIKKW